MLQIYNSLSRTKEVFEPRKAGHIDMYVCGMTVYDYCHIGHARLMIEFDCIYRHFLASGYTVNYVRNITDVDDKIIARANDNGEEFTALTERYIDAMFDDENRLGLLPPVHTPRCTDHIPDMIALIDKLVKSGHAYQGDNGDVYYAVSTFDEYGKLSGRKLSELRAGERVAVDEGKRDPLDFVLWKSVKPNEPHWDSPWGPGRPGWHIECSAMAAKELGVTFDIHGGGMDLQFPHHENEIAQSEAAHQQPMARYWLHNGFVQMDNEKMSKSLGNFFTIRDVLEHYHPEEIRMLMAGSHYRSPLNYSDDTLDKARSGLRRLYASLRGLDESGSEDELSDTHVKKFQAAMDDDFNTPEALAVLFDLVSEINRAQKSTSNVEGSVSVARLAATLRSLGHRLGLLTLDADQWFRQGYGQQDQGGLTESEIDALVAERRAARAARDWARSDEIRDQLSNAGIEVEDRDGESIWRRR